MYSLKGACSLDSTVSQQCGLLSLKTLTFCLGQLQHWIAPLVNFHPTPIATGILLLVFCLGVRDTTILFRELRCKSRIRSNHCVEVGQEHRIWTPCIPVVNVNPKRSTFTYATCSCARFLLGFDIAK